MKKITDLIPWKKKKEALQVYNNAAPFNAVGREINSIVYRFFDGSLSPFRNFFRCFKNRHEENKGIKLTNHSYKGCIKNWE